MLYIVSVEYKRSHESPSEYVCGNLSSLFNLCYTLNSSDIVKEFKVSMPEEIKTTPKDFGWGNFEKWVVKWHNQV